jgi:hypothetical protein
VFEAYFDESGDPADPAIEAFTLSFLVASQKDWKRFETSWGRILRRYKISVMHMKDYEHRINEFAGWDIPKKEAFGAELAGVLKNACIHNGAMSFIVSENMAKQNSSRDGN